MFKNLTLYRINGDVPASAAALDEALQQFPFAPPGKTQPMAAGWVPPREEGGALVEAVAGQWIIKLMIETRMLPAAVVAREVEAMAAKIEEATGRKPGKKQRAELKDEALLKLLSQAFTKIGAIRAWIDPTTKLLAIDTSSSAKAELLMKALVACAAKMNLHPLQTINAPDALMSDWLAAGEASHVFAIDSDCELKAPDGAKPLVRYARHWLDSDNVRAHLAAGKRVTKLGLTYDGKVSFELHANGSIRKVAVASVEGAPPPADGDADAFDADVTLATGELMPMIMALVDALGGESVLPLEAAASDAAPPPADTEVAA